MRIGAQFYTVREYCKDTAGFAETLRRVADIGYTTVQISGTCDYDAQWLSEQLRATGLTCVLTHIKGDKILADPKAVCDEHKIFGCSNIGLGMIPSGKGITEEKYQKFVSDFLHAAREIAANGCKFFYHNHCEELNASETGRTYLERMAEDFSPDEMNFTLDTYWVQYGGADPCDYLGRLSGRLECIHLKDMIIYPEGWEHRMAPVGHGNMNFERIINVAGDCGVKYLLVEQDKCYGEDPFDCLKKSYEYLRSLGLN